MPAMVACHLAQPGGGKSAGSRLQLPLSLAQREIDGHALLLGGFLSAVAESVKARPADRQPVIP